MHCLRARYPPPPLKHLRLSTAQLFPNLLSSSSPPLSPPTSPTPRWVILIKLWTPLTYPSPDLRKDDDLRPNQWRPFHWARPERQHLHGALSEWGWPPLPAGSEWRRDQLGLCQRTSDPRPLGTTQANPHPQHILNYPVVNDSVATFKSTPLGQRSLELGDSAYRTFAVPVLPYFSWPLQLITPYAKKADDLGDKTLSRVDEKFPIVKKPTDELISDARSMASLPLRVGQTGKEHVLSTYGAELDKTGGNGFLGRGKAAVTTALILASESLSTVSSYMYEKKQQASEVVEEKTTSS